MEDSAFENQRIVRRRLMGGAEVRRLLHIVYFVNRNGCNEHPHLIRIHHLSKNGVRLKDIKRWLAELRGKDMPDSFAWSYKRRYKTGYIWQDLLDDDLVTPISDNEYVLKGSEISSTSTNIEQSSPQESAKQTPSSKLLDIQTHASDASTHVVSPKSLSDSPSSKLLKNQTHSSDSSMHVVSPKSSSEIEDSSPTFGSESSTLTDVSGNDELESNSDTVNQGKHCSRKSHSSGILRNLITCGGVDTDDSVVVVVTTNKRTKPFLNVCSSHSSVGVKDSAKNRGRYREPCASYKPLFGPNCAQCGKRFKPEKLHAHMKSCKGVKAKKPAPLSAARNISTATRNESSVSGYLLAR